jgi:TatD DNase family protein
MDQLDAIRSHARHARVVAIGEIGLDTFRDYAPLDVQQKWLRAQLALADEVGLPVIIHQRSQLENVLAMLEEAKPEAGGVLHCFDQDTAAVERARKLGFKIGLGGVLTYAHAELDEAVREAPEDMLLLETDAPYLEPEPRSLKRNEPSLLVRVVKRLCELRGWTAEQAVAITRRNAKELFRLPIG